VFSGEPLRAVEQLRRTDVIPPALLADYQKLLSSQVGRRLNPAKVGGVCVQRDSMCCQQLAEVPCCSCQSTATCVRVQEVLATGISAGPSLVLLRTRGRQEVAEVAHQVAESKFLNNRLVEVVAFMLPSHRPVLNCSAALSLLLPPTHKTGC
jgi:hypothetical protein